MVWKGREVTGLLLAVGGFIAIFPLLSPAGGCPLFDVDPLCDDTFERCRRFVGYGCAGTPLQAFSQAALISSVVASAFGVGLIAWYARDLRTGRFYADLRRQAAEKGPAVAAPVSAKAQALMDESKCPTCGSMRDWVAAHKTWFCPSCKVSTAAALKPGRTP